MEDVEIELQFKVGNVEPLKKLLEREGVFQYENAQHDEYFVPPHRDFRERRPLDEWLRIRNSDGKQTINYKNWHREDDGRSYHCDEYETKVEDISKVRKIFEALQFKPIVVVEKLRKVWMYKEFEVSLDTVKGLGDFVELEYKGKDPNANPKKIGHEMIQLLKEVGCGKLQISYQGYPFLLMFPTEEEYEDVAE